jgi:hypothetical protein
MPSESKNGTENPWSASPRGAARGHRTHRRSESVGTDSRVLRPARPATRPADASGAKYFSHCKAADVGVNACAKLRASGRNRVKFFRKNKNYDSAETRIPSAFMH